MTTLDERRDTTTPPLPATDTVIGVDRVTKRFGSVLAVDGVALDIQRGEFFSMLGPSGCGKTTTLRMIAGFERPTTGRILLEGRDVSEVPPYKRNVNMVFQQYALFPHMNVYDNVAFGPRSKKLSSEQVKSRVNGILEVVRLEGMEHRRPGELSGGQQQRVALARALVNFPSALLLDEPLGALDLKLRRQMQLELKRIQRDLGITFVYVTHDQEEALTMSDRVAVMNQGKVEQLASPEEIYQRPATSFVAGFIGLANILAAKVERADGEVIDLAFPEGGGTTARARDGNLRPGEDALVVLRPERMRVSTEEPSTGALGRIRARVKDVVFQGPVVRIELETADKRPLVVVQLTQERRPDFELEGEVWVAWDEGSAYALPAGHIPTVEETLKG